MNWRTLRALVCCVTLIPLACRGGSTNPSDGPPAQVSVALGDNQGGATGQPLANPFVVDVTDQAGDPTPGVTVNWAVTGGSGTVSNASSQTNASGRASTTLTPGQTGENTVSATVNSLTPATFTAFGQGVVSDPTGDEFSTSASAGLVAPDIVELRAWPAGGNLRIEIEFADNVVSEATGGSNVAVGIVDIDTDQDPGTGVTPVTDGFRPGPGSTGLGSDYIVGPLSSTSEYDVINTVTTNTVGTITPTYNGNVLSMTIPLSMLGDDDGFVSLATVMGTVPEPTDIAPENQSLVLNITRDAVAVAGSSDKASPASPRLEWGSWR